MIFETGRDKPQSLLHKKIKKQTNNPIESEKSTDLSLRPVEEQVLTRDIFVLIQIPKAAVKSKSKTFMHFFNVAVLTKQIWFRA